MSACSSSVNVFDNTPSLHGVQHPLSKSLELIVLKKSQFYGEDSSC